jgi:DNA-binding MarR family transcriptional regulator
LWYVGRAVAWLFAHHGLGRPHQQVNQPLLVLRSYREQSDLSGAVVALRCFVTPQTMRQIVAKLEVATLISRRVHPEHGRILETYLMERGEALVSRSHQVVEDIEERMLAGFDTHERIGLLAALHSLVDGLESGEKL